MNTIEYRNLDQAQSFKKLKSLAEAGKVPELKDLLTAERISAASIPAGGGLTYNYAAKQADEEILELLYSLAEEQQVLDKYLSLLKGERINTGEDRMVLHQLTRGECAGYVTENGSNLGDFYSKQAERFFIFAKDVHSGKIKGSTGKKFETVVQIGIGGSDLGPRALYLALRGWAEKNGCLKMKADFISNVDPDDAAQVFSGLNPETTLFILVSKSGTTQETLTNHRLAIKMMEAAGIPGLNPSLHMAAVTSQTSPLASSSDFLDSFYIDDYIGGRYSSTSAVGGVILSLAFGGEVFKRLLNGAHKADLEAMKPRRKTPHLPTLFWVFLKTI